MTLWLAGLLVARGVLGQSAPPLPQWHLGPPRQSVGGEALPLHRVRRAAFLSGGEIVIADGGNTRVLIVSPAGVLLRSFGKSGSGPGDFQMLWDLAVIRDTILTYDTGLQRVSLWKPSGDFIQASSLAIDPGRMFTLRTFVSPSEFIITGRANRFSGLRGLYTDTVAIVKLDARTGVSSTLGRRAWEQQYFYPEAHGSQTYSTPFLGQALLAATTGRLLTVPLAGAEVEIARPDGSPGTTLPLPVSRRPFDRTLIDSYRDSMIRLNRRAGAGPANEARLRDMFGPDFPLPMHRPVIELISVVGKEVWLRAFPTGRATTTWYVVDAEHERLAGQLELPAGWRVLGGNERSVLVLQRDELDVESLVVFDVIREPR